MIPWLSISMIMGIAMLKAVADTLVHHYDTSVFRHLGNQSFWNPAISQNKPVLKYTKYRLDAWHLANSGWISEAVVLAVQIREPFWPWYIEYPLLGMLFIVTFNLFYNKLFRTVNQTQ